MAAFTKVPAHIGIALAFFGGITTVFMLQTLKDDPNIIVVPPTGSVTTQPVVPAGCRSDQDCASQTAVCNQHDFCEELPSPVCTCSQPQVLQCADAQDRAKHTFCPNGCQMTPQGARCL